jgi:hypothetical protein
MIYKLEINENGFKGFAEINIPSFVERMKIVKDSEIKDGVKLEEIEKVVYLVDMTKKQTSKIELKHDSGLDIKKIDELELYQEGLGIIYKISGTILNGISLGNLN